jgi:hypothetical protein
MAQKRLRRQPQPKAADAIAARRTIALVLAID